MFTRKKAAKEMASSNQKMFRRSNAYPAEYILLAVAGFALILVTMLLVHSIAGTFTSSYMGSSLRSIAQYLTMFIIFAPAFYWLYARVTGEEMVRPEVRSMGVRSVFLSLFIVGSVLVFLLESIRGIGGLVSYSVGVPNLSLNKVLIELIASAVVIAVSSFVISLLVKRSNRQFTMRAGVVLGALSVAMILASIGGIINVKSHQETQPTNRFCRVMSDSGACVGRPMRGPRG